MSGILIGNGTVVTLGSDNQLIEQGAVLVQDSRIAAIGSDTTLRQQHPAAQYVDAYGGLIMPGFLCTHTHSTHSTHGTRGRRQQPATGEATRGCGSSFCTP